MFRAFSQIETIAHTLVKRLGRRVCRRFHAELVLRAIARDRCPDDERDVYTFEDGSSLVISGCWVVL